MDILMDRADGDESQNFSYLLRYNVSSGNVEFVTRGLSGTTYTETLINSPYIERWYHVAVVRNGSTVSAYVDGNAVSLKDTDFSSIGDTTGNGLAIGGVGGNSKLFYGDIIEAAIYSSALSQSQILTYMFQDQRNVRNLQGYYKLGYSTNANDFYHNFVPLPPSGTDPAVKVGTGTITFDEVDQAGEQSIFDANLNHGENATTPLSGAFAWQQTALARAAPGILFDLEFGYSSALPPPAPNIYGFYSYTTKYKADPYDKRELGNNWRLTFDTRVVAPIENANEIDLITWDGSVEAWTRMNQSAPLSTLYNEYNGEMIQLTNAEVVWTNAARIVYKFRDPNYTVNGNFDAVMAGRLDQISDFNGNTVQLQWDETEGLLTNVVDTAGGDYQFNYDYDRELLTNVTFGSWQANFAYDSNSRLVSKSITNTSGLYGNVPTTWQFQYNANNGLLESIIDPRGSTNLFVQYDKYGRQTNEMDALGRTTGTEYDEPNTWQLQRNDPYGSQWIETDDHKGHILAQQDPLGNTTSYSYDTNGNRTSITEPLGWTTYFAYDNRANVIASTNALGQVTRWTFDSFFNKPINKIDPLGWTNYYVLDSITGNLLNNYDDLGTLVSYTYATNGLVLTSTDADGHTSHFAYDTNGFLIAKTDPATNTTTYTYNSVGWKLAETNALGQITSFAFDLNGNVVSIVDPLQRVFTKTYDADGNLLSASDGESQLTTFTYDTANEKTSMTDRTGTNSWMYFYTSRGKLDHITDPLGNVVTDYYDAVNRLMAVSDPLGQSISNIYDPNGNLVKTIDKLGQSWAKTYDRLDRVIAETDPLGNTRQTTYDSAGRIKTITTPNEFVSTHNYDGRGRLIQWVDAENFKWLYNYDGVGNITNITDALNGHYVMAYGPRNERTLERNQDNFVWHYSYDPLLRLQQQTDPNGTTRTLDYDPGGRVQSVTFNTGRVNSFAYDDNDNPTVLSRSGSGPATISQLQYDTMDRVVGYIDAFGKNVNYAYDALGRVATLKYPDGKMLTNNYDALSRLTNQVDWAGRQMSYTYDKANRLILRTYPNGIVQTNSFDNDGRVTDLDYAASTGSSNSISVALAYAYDRNGNKVGSTEQGTLNWPTPSLIDQTTAFTAAGRMVTRTDTVSPTNNFTYQYDANGNMTNAVGVGQSYTLTYDEDNRTTSIYWQFGAMMDETVTNRYDALGRRISETAAGIETRYVLDLVGNMESALCDMNSAGVITAWYVHGPDLCYKVDATNGLTCYHADAMGNIISLTDGNTNLVAQYAYTPYGRSLGSTNFSSQISNPYLFAGSQGVMEESPIPNLYFMRARYYSADAGVFLSTDPIKHIGPGWMPVAYVYVANNPMGFNDPTGKITPADDAIAAGLGAFIGFASSVITQGVIEHQNINWNEVAGSTVGGAVGGFLFVNPELGGPVAAGAAVGATENLVDQGLNNIEGQQSGFNVTSFVTDTTIGGVTGLIPGGGDASDIIGSGATASSRSAFVSLNIGTEVDIGAGVDLATRLVSNQASQAPSSVGNPSQPSSQNNSSGGNSGGGGSPFAASTPAAYSYATVASSHATPPAPPTVTIIADPPHNGSVGGNNAFTSVVNTIVQVAQNNVTHTVQQVVNTVSTAVTSVVNAVSSAWHTFTSWF
jgi:RHS repeat-associated protein